MGGGAFLQPAIRLSTQQHQAFEQYCKQSLKHHFQTIVSPRFLGDKSFHGDLDLVCAWQGGKVGTTFKGQDSGRLAKDPRSSGMGDSELVNRTALSATAQGGPDTSEERQLESDPDTTAQTKQWTEDVVQALRGDQWQRMNVEAPILSVGIPLSVFEQQGGSVTARQAGEHDSVSGSGRTASSAIEGWEQITRELRGSGWTTRGLGPVVLARGSVAVPCHFVCGPGTQDATIPDCEEDIQVSHTYTIRQRMMLMPKSKPFYQVDLLLVPPSSVPFARFFLSYGHTLAILCAALRLLACQVALPATHLGLLYRPYANLAPIRLTLSNDPKEVCGWLGLNPETWEKGMSSEEELWRWMVSEEGKGGVLDEAWRRVRAGYVKVQTCGGTGQRRPAAWKRFAEWLVAQPESEAADTLCLKTMSLGLAVNADDQEPEEEGVPAPQPLHPVALGALVRWEKTAELEWALEERKDFFRRAVEKQKRKEASRARWRERRLEAAAATEEVAKPT